MNIVEKTYEDTADVDLNTQSLDGLASYEVI